MIQRLFEYAAVFKSDINEHLPALADLSSQVDHITELGVRDMVSTWAFLEGLRRRGKGKLISIDIVPPHGISPEVVSKNAKNEGIQFEFKIGDSHKVELEPTDFLFIDTIHTGEHLKKELELHASKVRKYIGFHDIASCEKELIPVIGDFLTKNKEWRMFAIYPNNNGVIIITK